MTKRSVDTHLERMWIPVSRFRTCLPVEEVQLLRTWLSEHGDIEPAGDMCNTSGER